jgi:hypothetical protein
MKPKPNKPRSLTEIDVDLENALAEMRRRCDRLEHGRVILVVDRHGSMTIGHRTSVEHLLAEDIERIMTERPHKEVAGCR